LLMMHDAGETMHVPRSQIIGLILAVRLLRQLFIELTRLVIAATVFVAIVVTLVRALKP
jgi:hypothetical protein